MQKKKKRRRRGSEGAGWRHEEMQWQRYSCRRGVDDVGGRGSSRESTLRSININLGRLTHKAEYSTHPRELWASCSEGRASAAAPPRINYIYLWCPGVSCYCRFFFLMCFFFMEPAALTLALTARLHPPTERCSHVNYLRCVLPAFLRPVMTIFSRVVQVKLSGESF